MDKQAFIKTIYGVIAALALGVIFAEGVKFLIKDAGKIDLSTKTVVFITLAVPLIAGGVKLMSQIPDKTKDYFAKKIKELEDKKVDKTVYDVEIKDVHDKVDENYAIVTRMSEDLKQVRDFIFEHINKGK